MTPAVRPALLAALAAIGVLALAHCGDATSTSGSADGGTTGGDGRADDGGGDDGSGGEGGGSGAIKTIFLVVMENHNWSDIAGSSSAPYINGTLLVQGAHAEQYFNPPGLHPSEPNYIWLEAGSNMGLTTDADPSASNHATSTDHLVTQLEKAGVSWKAYLEGVSGSDCPLSSSGYYAVKHVGMLFFDDVSDGLQKTSQHCKDHVRPYSELAGDLGGGKAARFNYVIPNLCDDMHGAGGCPSDDIAAGDKWLSSEMPHILQSTAFAEGGALLVTWDEGEGGDGPIGMIVMSKAAKVGYAGKTHYTHSSTLRTIETVFGVAPLRDAAKASDLADLFQTFP